jgi:hypothetical protein
MSCLINHESNDDLVKEYVLEAGNSQARGCAPQQKPITVRGSSRARYTPLGGLGADHRGLASAHP